MLNTLLITMQNVFIFYSNKLKYHYFLKYNWENNGGQEKYRDINVYSTAIII